MKNILKENMLRFGTKNLSESDKVKLSERQIYDISVRDVEELKNQGMSIQEIIDYFNKKYGNSWFGDVEKHYKYLEKETPQQRNERHAGYTMDSNWEKDSEKDNKWRGYLPAGEWGPAGFYTSDGPDPPAAAAQYYGKSN